MQASKIFLGLIFSGLFVSLSAADKTIDSKISRVTVFLNGATVTRTGVTSLPAGKHTLKLDNLPSGIDANSIQAGGKGDITILAVNYKYRKVGTEEWPKRAEAIQDSIDILEFQMALNNNTISALSEEKKMIMANNKVDYAKLGFAVEDLEDLSDYFRSRISTILDSVTQKSVANAKLSKQKNSLQQKLNKVLQEWRKLNGEIYLDVFAKTNTKATFEVSYYVNNAGWYPVYNLKAKDIESPVTVNYNAKVYQATGVSWKNVLLTLSTTNPRFNNNKPNLEPWRLDFISPNQANGYSYQINGAQVRATKDLAETATLDMQQEMEPAGTAANFTNVTQNITSVSFDIKLPYTIKGDGEHQLVNIQNLELQADYEYYAAPKLSHNAFLLAKVKNWEDKNLLPGEANIYLQNTFVGKSTLNPRNTNDALELSFGVDKSVVITRERIKNYCSSTFLGSNKKEAIGYEIKVRNTKSTPIKIKIEDQVPVATNDDISVDVEETSDAELNKDTGILTWEKTVLPASVSKMEVKFEVKFPKDKFVNL